MDIWLGAKVDGNSSLRIIGVRVGRVEDAGFEFGGLWFVGESRRPLDIREGSIIKILYN